MRTSCGTQWFMWLSQLPCMCVCSPDTQRKGSTHSFEHSGSVCISGCRGNKLTDPVEEYRTNYHMEALEAHVPVPIDGFINKLLVMRTNDNQLFLEEFGSIEMAPQQPCSVAELPANRSKNRYHNILPYDHSRVKLSHGKGQSDYINASYCSVSTAVSVYCPFVISNDPPTLPLSPSLPLSLSLSLSLSISISLSLSLSLTRVS